MAKYIYKNEVEGGQIVRSDEPREDLERSALWENVSDTHRDEPEPTPIGSQVDADGNVIGDGHTATGQVDATHAGEGKDLPDGDPTDKWTVEQLEQFATIHEVNLDGAKNKGDKLEAIAKAVAARG
ncbi:hypothetical protein [Pseudoclavibacter helvolus]|uniref:hypothetical protein n=1 Tax=Pseudoclavibacter helvolus TaxID=255205 RepID=UPI0035E6F9A6